MSEKIRNPKKKKTVKRKYIPFFIVLGILLYIVFHMYNTINAYTIKTHVLDMGQISNFVEKEGLIIRNEYQVFSPSDGYISDSLSEGERVKKAGVIAKLQNEQLKGDEQFKLQIINRRINELKNNTTPKDPEKEIAELDAKIDFIYVDIQNRIVNNDLTYVSDLKENLISLMERRRLLSGASDVGQMSLEQLEAEKLNLENKINSDKYYIRADNPGVVSFYSDGEYEKFSIANMANISVTDITSFKDNNLISINDGVNKGDIFATVVNNHKWYIACEVDENDIRNIERGRPITIHIGDEMILGSLYDFHKGEDEKFLGIFEVENENFDFTKQRKHKFNLEYSFVSGIIVPKDSIVENEGVLGVFTINQVGTALFKELKDVKGEDEKNYIISFNPDSPTSQENINLYDEVIIAPRNIKSGQRVR